MKDFICPPPSKSNFLPKQPNTGIDLRQDLQPQLHAQDHDQRYSKFLLSVFLGLLLAIPLVLIVLFIIIYEKYTYKVCLCFMGTCGWCFYAKFVCCFAYE
jgi:hypothetical protein